MLKIIKNKLKKIPKYPGVYFFKDKNGKIIYIGKALSLKNRIESYFRENQKDLKTKILVSQIADFDFQVVPSEFDALLLEAKLIKEHQPKYNTRLKDNKRYLYIAITKPPQRIFPLRRPELEKKLDAWFGPFPSSRDIKLVLQTIRKVFPFCSEKKPPKRECFYKHLHLCPGFQKLKTRQYQQQIKHIKQILSGKGSKLLLKNLEKKMKMAAAKNDFEKAQKYKNQFLSLQRLTQNWQTMPSEEKQNSLALTKLRNLIIKYQQIEQTTISKIEAYDVANLGYEIIVGAMVTFINGQPEKSLYRKFNIKKTALKRPSANSQKLIKTERTSANDPADLARIIDRRFNHPEWLYPQLILVDGGKSQISAAFKILKKHHLENQISLLGLTKKEEEIILPKIKSGVITGWLPLKYASNNPVLKLLMQLRDEAHRFSQNYYHKLHFKKLLS